MRVRAEVLDRFLSTVGEVIIASTRIRNAVESGDGSRALVDTLDHMDRVVAELKRRAIEVRTIPLIRVMDSLPRVAREVAVHGQKRVELDLLGAELELDRAIVDRLNDPLVHLVRNAVDHGIEMPEERDAAGKDPVGRVSVEATREKDCIRLTVRDDGAGIDLEAVRERAVRAGLIHGDLAEDLPPAEIAALVFAPGLSTAKEVSEVSGRGVGMDAVKATIEALGGTVEVETEPGTGTATSLIVPVAAAVQRVVLLGVGEETVAVPIGKVQRILEIESESIERAGSEAFALINDEPILIVDLAEHLRVYARPPGAFACIALTEVRGETVGLLVSRFEGQLEVYVKPTPVLLDGVRALGGLTVLGDGRPVFVLDVNQLV